MSRILLAWELGGGYGHLGPFLALAPELLKRGHELHVAAREVAAAVRAVGDLPVAVHQAPLCTAQYGGLQDPPLNFAEILMRFGYLDPAMLRGLLAAWCSLQRAIRADVVIADHAPTALLAARSLGVPCAVIGSAFNVPPPVSPCVNMRPWLDVPQARLADSDRRVLEVINTVLPQGRRLETLPALFDGAARFFSGVPELDPYGPRDPSDYLGLLSLSTGSALPQWPAGDGPRVFAYLHADYVHAGAVLHALAAADARVLLHVLGGDNRALQRFTGERLALAPALMEFSRVVAESDLCVCHGNAGTTLGMLGGGRPLLILPKHLENHLLGIAVQRNGAGLVASPDAAPDVGGMLRTLLSDPRYGAAAKSLAHRSSSAAIGTITMRAAARIEALAAQRGEPS